MPAWPILSRRSCLWLRRRVRVGCNPASTSIRRTVRAETSIGSSASEAFGHVDGIEASKRPLSDPDHLTAQTLVRPVRRNSTSVAVDETGSSFCPQPFGQPGEPGAWRARAPAPRWAAMVGSNSPARTWVNTRRRCCARASNVIVSLVFMGSRGDKIPVRSQTRSITA